MFSRPTKHRENIRIRKRNFFRYVFLKRIHKRDIVLFTRQMSDLVDASIPLLQALKIVADQTKNVYLNDVILKMHHSVKDGGSFSDALNQHPDIFSNLFVNMVRAGEVSGELEHTLSRLADYLEKEHETQSKVRSSLAYPAMILMVGIITIFVLLTVVIPRITVMFDDLDQQLPMATVFLVSVSNFFAHFWWMILSVGILCGLYLKHRLSTDEGQLWFDSFKLKIPLLSSFIKIVEVGRFSRTLGTLVESGVPISTALNSVWPILENAALQIEMKRVADEVTQGASLKKALKQCRFFPETAVSMISIGEESGKLDRGLYKIADSFERESDRTVKTMISLLGPAVLIVIVAIVGFVVISMLLPIFQMNLLIQ